MTAAERLIATAEDQVGYMGKRSNAQLDDFKANAPGSTISTPGTWTPWGTSTTVLKTALTGAMCLWTGALSTRSGGRLPKSCCASLTNLWGRAPNIPETTTRAKGGCTAPQSRVTKFSLGTARPFGIPGLWLRWRTGLSTPWRATPGAPAPYAPAAM